MSSTTLGRLVAIARGAPRTLRELPGEVRPALSFVLRGLVDGRHPLLARLGLLARFYRTTLGVDCAHRQSEILEVVSAILALDPAVPGVVVEAGAYKGGSAAKLSLACARVGRRLWILDSFVGLPDHLETVELGAVIGARGHGEGRFEPGAYAGSLSEVRHALARFGAEEVCELVPGWLEDTLPRLEGPVAVAFVDVDLEASERVCLRSLYPRLSSGGALFSHDGHLPAIRALLADRELWAEIGAAPPPAVHGLGRRRLVRVDAPGPGSA